MVEKLIVLNLPHPAKFAAGLKTWRQLLKSWYSFWFQMPWLPELMFKINNYQAIARALVSQPQLVLADESTAALDSKSGRNIVEIMQQLAKEEGCTILLVTHDNRILDIADRIVHMEDGRLARDTALVRS